MKSLVGLLACGALLLAATGAYAQDTPQDADGCKDSPLIGRFPGSHIASCDHKEFEQADFPTTQGGDTKHLEGEYWRWDVNTRDGVSEIQVYRNFENALKKAGFTVDYAGPPEQLTVHKDNTWIFIDNRGSYYYQTIVAVEDMKQEMTADASALAGEIEKSGHVALYGITFDTGKATILPASESELTEIVTLLHDNPDLKLRVEGHTDNQGAAAANQALSEKRAQAVVAWLTGHGVAASRLTAKGFGQTQPVADNGTEDGRAKNRRVELAKP